MLTDYPHFPSTKFNSRYVTSHELKNIVEFCVRMHFFIGFQNWVFLSFLVSSGKKFDKNATWLHILLWKKMSAWMVTVLSKTVEVEHTN